MKQRWVYILCLMLMGLFNLKAQDVSIESRLDTNVIMIGAQTKLNVDIQYPTGQDVKYRVHQDSIINAIEVLDFNIDTLTEQAGKQHFKITYTITSFDTGYYAIPPQFLTFSGDTIAESQPLIMAVNTFAIDSTKQAIFDIKAPIEAPWTISEFFEEYGSYIIIAILIILLVIILLWYFKKRKKTPEEPKKVIVPKEAAHIIALRDLEKLKAQKLWQNDRVKEYYIELSNILRTYIENRFKIPAMEQTSAEILGSFQNARHLDESQTSMLRHVLNTADMVKFAKAKPLANENDLSLKNAFALVEATQLTEPVKEEGNDV